MGAISSGVSMDLPALTSAAGQINSVTGALTGLTQALRQLGSGKYMLVNPINTMFAEIAQSATRASDAVTGVSGALGGVGGGGGAGAGGASWVGTATASASAAIAAAGPSITPAMGGGGGGNNNDPPNNGGGGGGGGVPPVGVDLSSSMVGLGGSTEESEQSFIRNLLMFPLRFARGQMETNRQTALTAGAAMSRQAFATGTEMGGAGGILEQMSKIPGAIQGTISDLLSLYSNASGYGAMYNWEGGQNAPRTAGFLEGVQEAQMITPGRPVAEIAQTLGGYASNTRAQQQAQMTTGGAMGMIKPGGGQKSLSEWAESVMRWLEGLKTGGSGGFDHGELLAQYFPGSNIDAWFEVNGVPQEMREYWWSYALAKTKSGGKTTDTPIEIKGQGDVLWNRLKATTAMTTGQFNLAGIMSGAYSNKEQANQWFNQMFSDFLEQLLPAAVGAGNLNFMQFLPDTVEQMMMQFLERSGKGGAIAAGALGYGNLFSDDWGEDTAPVTTTTPDTGLGGLPTPPPLPDPVSNPTTVEQASSSPASLRSWLRAQNDAGQLDEDEREQAMDVAEQQFDAGNDPGGKWRTLYNDIMEGDFGDEEVGDEKVGDTDGIYGDYGGNGLAGLHPDMRRKVGDMMQANPRLRVTSGLRDNAMQKRLKARGVGKVSGKPSAHTRGMAADLGPTSEYNWIRNNASKFGLKSGAGVGEPWHVGMGDPEAVGDVWDAFTGAFNIFDALSELVPPGGDKVEGVAGLVTTLMQMMQGNILTVTGQGATEAQIAAGLAPDKDLYTKFINKTISMGITTGGILNTTASGEPRYGTIEWFQQALLGQGVGAAAGFAGAGAAGTTPLPTGGSSGSVEAGSRAAVALHNAGFQTRDELIKITQIAGRESGWDPTQENPNGEDKGLMQINIKAHRDRIAAMGYTGADMMDIQKNANVAHKIYADSGNFMAWNFSEQSMQWGPPPRPGWAPANNPYPSSPFMRTDEAKATQAVTAAHIPGIGDVLSNFGYDYGETDSRPIPTPDVHQHEAPREFAYAAASVDQSQSSSTQVVFHNTFNIQGGGGSGGIDLRRTVTMMADHLEDEMKTRRLRGPTDGLHGTGSRTVYRPAVLAPKAYGWAPSPQYNRADVPTALMDRPATITSEQLRPAASPTSGTSRARWVDGIRRLCPTRPSPVVRRGVCTRLAEVGDRNRLASCVASSGGPDARPVTGCPRLASTSCTTPRRITRDYVIIPGPVGTRPVQYRVSSRQPRRSPQLPRLLLRPLLRPPGGGHRRTIPVSSWTTSSSTSWSATWSHRTPTGLITRYPTTG